MKKTIVINKADLKAALWTIFMIVWTIFGAVRTEASWYSETTYMWIVGGAVVYIFNMAKIIIDKHFAEKENK